MEELGDEFKVVSGSEAKCVCAGGGGVLGLSFSHGGTGYQLKVVFA